MKRLSVKGTSRNRLNCHPHADGDLEKPCKYRIPAFAGMTENGKNAISRGALKITLTILMAIELCACGTKPPKDSDNICSIFKQYPKWYWSAQKVEKKWGEPTPVLMAIMHQESRFRQQAKPPRRKILWFIPWFRPTSAYGYSQATDESWRAYQQSTGYSGANRSNFSDALNFVGWYGDQAHRRTEVAKNDAYNLYLAYHEGIGGYTRGTYRKKQWLLDVAHKVQNRSWLYNAQLTRCKDKLPRKQWWHFW